MKQGLLKKSSYIFTFLIAFALVLSPDEEAKALEIKYDSNMFCVDNAVAPLDNLFDIQTFLSCNGFNPGPIDGLSGSRTNNAIITFQKSVGLTPDGIIGPATKQAMRAYSTVSFTFTGSGWGHGVGLSQYGAKGLTELGASFCSNTSSCTSTEVVNYYFKDTTVKSLSEISLSSPDIATNNNALWVGLARNARSINLTTLPSSSPPMLSICQDGLSDVAGVQGFLTSKGFEPGPVDGAFGDKTSNALKNYQASVGLSQSGSIDTETLNKIKSEASSDGSCESIFGPLKISGGATINVISNGNGCYFNGHPLVNRTTASCNIGISWSDGGRIRVGPREHTNMVYLNYVHKMSLQDFMLFYL